MLQGRRMVQGFMYAHVNSANDNEYVSGSGS